MSVVEFFSQPIWHRLGLTLVHFLWQGLAVGVLACVAVALLKLKRGNRRYGTYLLAFAVMAICPPITFAILGAPAAPAAMVPAPMPTIESFEPVDPLASPEPSQRPVEQTATIGTKHHTSVRENLDAALPWALLGWMAGVVILSVRLLLGFIGVRRWRRNLEPVPEQIDSRLALLSQRLGLRGFRRVFVSHRALEVVAVGYLRPMVLLPAAMAALPTSGTRTSPLTGYRSIFSPDDRARSAASARVARVMQTSG